MLMYTICVDASYTYTHVYSRIHIYIYIHMCVCTLYTYIINIFVYAIHTIYVYRYIYIYTYCTYLHTYIHIHTCIYIYIYTIYIYVIYVYTYIYIYIYTYMHCTYEPAPKHRTCTHMMRYLPALTTCRWTDADACATAPCSAVSCRPAERATPATGQRRHAPRHGELPGRWRSPAAFPCPVREFCEPGF